MPAITANPIQVSFFPTNGTKYPLCSVDCFKTTLNTMTEIIWNSCNMGVRALPAMYAQLPEGLRPEGIHIRQSPK